MDEIDERIEKVKEQKQTLRIQIEKLKLIKDIQDFAHQPGVNLYDVHQYLHELINRIDDENK